MKLLLLSLVMVIAIISIPIVNHWDDIKDFVKKK